MDEGCVKLSGNVFVGMDRAKGQDETWYCEIRREADGTIIILDSYSIRGGKADG